MIDGQDMRQDFDPERRRFPLITRLVIRVATFVVVFFAIGIVSAVAKSLLAGHHGITLEDIALYRGGLNMLAILWFMGLLAETPKATPDKPQEDQHDK